MVQSGVRPVDAWVHTSEFLVRGRFHLRERSATASLLNADERPYLPMTDIAVYRSCVHGRPGDHDLIYAVPFAAVPKAHVVWVVGGAADASPEGQGRIPRTVYLLYADYVLSGSIHMRPELRLSDFVGQSMVGRPFVMLHDVRVLRPGAPGVPLSGLEVTARHPYATVNLKHAAGVLDQRDGAGSTAAR